MMEAKFVNPRENFLLRDTAFGKFSTHSDLVAVFVSNKLRGRVVVPAGAAIKKPHPKRVRAKLILQQMRSDMSIPRRLQDRIYTELLWQDGVQPWRARLERRLLAIAGYLRYGPGYAKIRPQNA